jgi:hypothetical protein
MSCKKYEEGPMLSFVSPEKRLVGLWEISSLQIDNINYVGTYSADSVYFRFSIVKYDELFINLVKENRHGIQYASSILELKDNKTVMQFNLKKQPIYEELTKLFYELLPAFAHENTWQILQLKSREFIIRENIDSTEYKITFEKIEKY